MRTAALFVLLLTAPAYGQTAASFDHAFTARTMRVDYFHTGGPGVEIFSLDRVVDDGEWAGSRTRLVDDTNLGKYFFEVSEAASNRPLYSRGFASIYGEWETTAEVRATHRTFHESLRFPWPKAPVRISLKKRQEDQSFKEVWNVTIDPASRAVNRAPLKPIGQVWTVFENGTPERKVDLVIIG